MDIKTKSCIFVGCSSLIGIGIFLGVYFTNYAVDDVTTEDSPDNSEIPGALFGHTETVEGVPDKELKEVSDLRRFNYIDLGATADIYVAKDAFVKVLKLESLLAPGYIKHIHGTVSGSPFFVEKYTFSGESAEGIPTGKYISSVRVYIKKNGTIPVLVDISQYTDEAAERFKNSNGQIEKIPFGTGYLDKSIEKSEDLERLFYYNTGKNVWAKFEAGNPLLEPEFFDLIDHRINGIITIDIGRRPTDDGNVQTYGYFHNIKVTRHDVEDTDFVFYTHDVRVLAKAGNYKFTYKGSIVSGLPTEKDITGVTVYYTRTGTPLLIDISVIDAADKVYYIYRADNTWDRYFGKNIVTRHELEVIRKNSLSNVFRD